MSDETLPELPNDWITAPGAPALHLFASDEVNLGMRLGGVPVAPEGWEWPRNSEGIFLDLLATWDLAQVQMRQPTEWLPPDGTLLFFYDTEQQPWGFDPKEKQGWRVEYFPLGTELMEYTPPLGVIPFNETQLDFCAIETYFDNTPETIPLTEHQFEYLQGFIESRNYQELPAHQALGFPLAVQESNMAYECELASHGVFAGNAQAYASESSQKLLNGEGVEEWRMLFQIDSDDDMDFMWGDMGRLYFLVKANQARQGHFENAWVVLQSY